MLEDTSSCIAVLVDRRTGEEFNISRYSVSIGREIGNDIVVVTDKTISRQHALIQYVNGKFHVLDLSSKNGTRLNGGLVGNLTELNEGDEVAVGLTQFIFMLRSEKNIGQPMRAAITEPVSEPLLHRATVNK